MADVQLAFAIVYATIVALSYKKVGLMSAILWPMTIFIIGSIVFISYVVNPPQDKT